MWVCFVCVFCLVGLLVVAIVEVPFFFFLVNCGMGGRFVVVVVWVVGFVVTVGSVVAGGAEISWVEKERDKGERGRRVDLH